MQSFKSPAMKTVACLSFFLSALIQSQVARGAVTNGSCNTTTTGKSYVAAPSSSPTSNLCGYTKTTPTVTDNGDNRWKWTCTASAAAGTNATCYAGKVDCGTATSAPSPVQPTTNLCTAGVAAATTPTADSWTWKCTGADTFKSCSTHKQVAGVCGDAINHPVSTAPVSDLCNPGTATPNPPTIDATTGKWTWTCAGLYGGASSGQCTADLMASCGTANGGYFSAAPTTNLCVPSSVAATNQTDTADFWLWDCSVPYNTSSCSAHKLINSVCGTASGGLYSSSPPAGLLCLSGALTAGPTSIDNNTRWQWTCAGGGTPPSIDCFARKPGACGTANGTTSSTQPSGATNLCSSGSSTTPTLTGDTWGWICTGGDGSNTNCSAYIPGICGAANGVSSVGSPPAATLCTSGSSTAAPVLSGNTWNWSCTGGGNSVATCSAPNGAGDGMTNYCQQPPFLAGGIKPNLLLMLDNSASMYDLAYSAGTFAVSTESFCYDTTYDTAQKYAGYFETAKVYKYNLTPSANHTTPDNLPDRFIESASLPAGCSYSTADVCVNKTGTGTTADPYKITAFSAKGNFLNWLSASKLDIQKQVLTGGKYDQANTVLTGESRGCNGRRFVKEVPALPGITFAVRGPNALEPDYVNPDTQGGLSRIEIYIGTNPEIGAACQDAINTWTSGNYGQAKGDVDDCLGGVKGATPAEQHELAAYNQIMQDCWTIKDNIANGGVAYKNGTVPSINSDETQCVNVYGDICGTLSGGICSDGVTTPSAIPAQITDQMAGAWQCTSSAVHPALPPNSPYNPSGSSDTTGYIGRCVTYASGSYIWDEACVKREVLHYCNGAAAAEVIDPSEGAADTAQTGGYPAILMDAAVRSIGTPAGTFFIRVQPGAVPTGIIQEYSTRIRFGTMGFNSIGSASEPSVMGTSHTGTNLDGAKILSYIGYDAAGNASESVGDHGTGVIRSVDDLVAETWTPLAEAFNNAIGYFARTSDYDQAPASRTDLRINPTNNLSLNPDGADFDATKNPSQYRCQHNNILLISDGASTADQKSSVSSLASLYNDGDGHYGASSSGTCPKFAGSQNLDDLAWLAKNRNIKTFTTNIASSDVPITESESIMTHVVYTGTKISQETAECNPDTLMQQTAINGGTVYHRAENPDQLKQALKDTLDDVAAQSSSGTAVSVLSSSEGSGSNLMQALFYPKRIFNGTEILWTSDLMNYWYYMDPFLSSSTIREDTVREGANASPPYTLLDLKQDYITQFEFVTDKTVANRRLDENGDGSKITSLPAVDIEATVPIWRAGFDLWWTDPTDRVIKTTVGGTTLTPFDTSNVALLKPYLGTTNDVVAKTTINYVLGYDCVDATGAACACGTACPQIGRSRTVTAGVCAVRNSPCNSSADCPPTIPASIPPANEACDSKTNVWKLGDIISSTPRIMGPGSLNTYNLASPFGYNDQTYNDFIRSDDYKNRQLAFVGANDGMLHAFKFGKLVQNWKVCSSSNKPCNSAADCTGGSDTCTGSKPWYQSAKMEGGTGAGGIGTESYAFIPENVLPYLQYLNKVDYCHIYMVDGPTVLSDVSINKPSTCTQADYWNCPKLTTKLAAPNSNAVDFKETSWRTTLIGSLGIGGATCDAAAADGDRISTPLSVSNNPVGWSSYFALDVTDQADPQLLWEFSNADLGVTNVGAAIVKAGTKKCSISNVVCTTDSNCGDIVTNGTCVSTKNTNGRWFAILASGSTGPISDLEFKGTSDKTLKLFVLDLKTGELLRTIDTNITNAFAGSFSTSALDLERDRSGTSGNYHDDAVYIGYVKDTTSGGVLRLSINDDINFNNWTVHTVITDIGPVTTSVVNLLDRISGKLWLYFAEGRFFYKQDDLATQRKLFGIQEPCFDALSNSISSDCTNTFALTDLKDQTTVTTVCSSSGGSCTKTADCPSGQTCGTLPLTAAEKGWYVNMNAAVAPMSAERVISNPTPDTLGAIYFLSFAPTVDLCDFGGTTYFWALDYKTGGQVTFDLQGKALVQVSTGEIKELNLPDALSEMGFRKSKGFRGIPPTGQGLMVIKNPDPIKKFMHVQEQ